MSFEGKSVLVTGGSRGIGRETALRFADEGAAKVAIGYLRNDRAAEETAAELQKRGAEAVLVRGNVSSERVIARGRRARAARRPRPQRGNGRDPSGARDRGQALGLDVQRERASAALAGARGGAVHAGGLCDRRGVEPGRAARARELRPRRNLEGGARVARPLPRRRARAARDPRQRRLRRASSRPARSSTSRTGRRCCRRAGSARPPAGWSSRDIADAVLFLASPQASMVVGQTLIVDGGFSLPPDTAQPKSQRARSGAMGIAVACS